ncbi:hypothetical protein S40285_06574 [Stachybotrys chlorohalonatus IBT 40285]|uniref:FAD dependent oxidoreductase domain-containing protein n=1 Tax=Stachybotrys chlorohalonatus (strain IBT 40285) TaxID=1283841 RepID=A0A084QD41_STAC4|nr:hypothetical protein S40285_06574 [Stachybotrys chlorohalonata IBT 40285]
MAQTVIIGSGIIGLSTAYHLSKHQPGPTIHLVDSSAELFASASGFAGGFLAKGWFESASAPLGRLSFEEHARLAEEAGGAEKWGYAKSVTVAYEAARGAVEGGWLEAGASRASAAGGARGRGDGGEKSPPWLRVLEGDEVSVMDDGGGTAIVDPLKLCHFLLDECKNAGVQVHHPATALEVTTDVRDEVASVRIGYTDSSTETEIPATRILLSAGAWTPLVFSTLFKSSTASIPVTAYAGHSLVVRNPKGAGDTCHAVYCSLENLSPELYSRPSGVIYLAGVNSSTIPLPPLATGAEPVDEALEELKVLARRLIVSEGELEVVRTGLCFRPVTPRGTPILARLEDGQLGERVGTRRGAEGGVFVAVGHGPWGISLSLGTGRVMAEMMQGRALSADVSRLGL